MRQNDFRIMLLVILIVKFLISKLLYVSNLWYGSPMF